MNPHSVDFKRLILRIEAVLLSQARLRMLLTDEDAAADLNDRRPFGLKLVRVQEPPQRRTTDPSEHASNRVNVITAQTESFSVARSLPKKQGRRGARR
jgi:hypothetical protein